MNPVPYQKTVDWYRIAAIAINTLIGGQGNVIAKTAAYTAVQGDDVILCNATTAAFTVTLPPAGQYNGLQFIIKKTDASVNAVTIDGNGAETIDGAATVVLGAQWAFRKVISNGTAWFVTAQ